MFVYVLYVVWKVHCNNTKVTPVVYYIQPKHPTLLNTLHYCYVELSKKMIILRTPSHLFPINTWSGLFSNIIISLLFGIIERFVHLSCNDKGCHCF